MYILDLNKLCALLSALRNMLDAVHHDGATSKCLKEGLSLATRLMHSTGKQSFISVCVTTESALLILISHLPSKKCLIQLLKFTSVIRHIHVIAGLHRSFEEQLTPQITAGVQKH